MFPITGASCCMFQWWKGASRAVALQLRMGTAQPAVCLSLVHLPSRQTLEDPRPVTLELPHPHIWVNYRLCLPKIPKR